MSERNQPSLWSRIRSLLVGVTFVAATLGVWSLFMRLTWWAGEGLLWRPAPADCVAYLPDAFLERLYQWFVGYNACANLHWTFGLLTLLAALWAVSRAFFGGREEEVPA